MLCICRNKFVYLFILLNFIFVYVWALTASLLMTCRSGYGGLGVSVLAFSTQVRGFKPSRNLSTPFFGGEVKSSVPCRRFAACKKSLNVAWKSTFRQNYQTTFSPTVPTSAAGIFHVVADVEAPGGEKWEHLKSGGKQWQATPKNLPRMQCTRDIDTSRLTELWSLPRPAQGLNTNNNNNK